MFPLEKTAILFSFIFFTLYCAAQSDSSFQVFDLGKVIIRPQTLQIDSIKKINQSTLNFHNKFTVAEALSLMPGIQIANFGDRNESVVYMRGFNLKQVPVFIDGIPVYVPFDGYVDLARFTHADIAQIEIEKTGASVIYGANTMGGAINLVSKKPIKPIAYGGSFGLISRGYAFNAYIGGKHKKFYYQADISQLSRNSYPLSAKYVPVKAEDGVFRNNAFNADNKLNLRVGFLQNNNIEHTLNFILQNGKKGNPPYAGLDSLNPRFKNMRYWQWPEWNKYSLYYIGNYKISSYLILKTRVFYDQFVNELKSYDDSTFSSQNKSFAFTSNYFDQVWGNSTELRFSKFKKHDLRAAFHYKYDYHQEQDNKTPATEIRDYTGSIGIEDLYTFGHGFSLITGVAYNFRNSLSASFYDTRDSTIKTFLPNKNAKLNGNIKLYKNFGKGAKNHFGIIVSNTSRFATMKDRYSQRLGTAIPNPNLLAEEAYNAELNTTIGLANNLKIYGAIFYNALSDAIQTVNNAAINPQRNKFLSQLQNTGNARFMGTEWNIDCQLKKYLFASVSYTFIERKQLDSPQILFVNVPKHNANFNLRYMLKEKLWLNVNLVYQSNSFSSSYGVVSKAFEIINMKFNYQLRKEFNISFGINNIMDKNYTLSEGFPEAGRNFAATLNFQF